MEAAASLLVVLADLAGFLVAAGEEEALEPKVSHQNSDSR